jgi:hypothetical protein
VGTGDIRWFCAGSVCGYSPVQTGFLRKADSSSLFSVRRIRKIRVAEIFNLKNLLSGCSSKQIFHLTFSVDVMFTTNLINSNPTRKNQVIYNSHGLKKIFLTLLPLFLDFLEFRYPAGDSVESRPLFLLSEKRDSALDPK